MPQERYIIRDMSFDAWTNPHGATMRASYTVPAGLQASLTFVFTGIACYAPSNLGAYVNWNFRTFTLATIFCDPAVSAIVPMIWAGDIPMTAGDVLYVLTTNSTTNQVNFVLRAIIREYV